MSKVRVYELAKETGLGNQEVIRRLASLGIEAKSHSSTVSEGDARAFKESLGRQRDEEKRRKREKAKAEAEQYDLEALAAEAEAAKARKVVPPHLRQQGDQGAAARPIAKKMTPGEPAEAQPGTPAGPSRLRPPTKVFRPQASQAASAGGTTEAAPAPAPAAEQPATAAPAARTGEPAGRQPLGPDEARRIAAAGLVRRAGESAPAQPAARQGQAAPPARPSERPPAQRPAQRPPERQDRPAEHPEGGAPTGVPGVPKPGTPPRPGESPVRRRLSPTATGMPVEPRRRVEHSLPQEGSGKRAIPPPIKAAPKDAPGRPAGDRGRPGGRPPSTGAPAGPGAGAGAGDRGRGRKGRKGRKRELTPQEQFEQENRPSRRRRERGQVKANVDGPIDALPGITVSELAKLMGVNPTDIVAVLFRMGEMVTVTQSMSNDLIELVAAEMDADINFITHEEVEFGEDEPDAPGDLVERAPVVTVMGHVDHGKTLLLDTIRHSDVVSSEAGGITQHIGAYQVRRDGRAITFIDTPGHEAFTAMRARGASVTDIAILVVAANDGVMPQTVEAINHAKAADVPIIVAVNKVDLEGADPTRVRGQLTEHDLIAEEFGGQTTMVDVSAKERIGIEDLLDLVLLQADVMELEANPDRAARGTVIEAHLDKGRGAVATVLVQNGTLRVGDVLVAGVADCKVRAMFDPDGNPVQEAGPSAPVQVLGFKEVPAAGDEFRAVDDERTARDIAEDRQSRERQAELANRKPFTLDALNLAVAEGKLDTLNLIVKGDVSGTVEALAAELDKLDVESVQTRIIHKGVGAVSENDVRLAETSAAIIIAFNVRPEANARRAIEESGVDLRQYSVIYEALEDIQAAVRGKLAPDYEEVVVGRAQVREIFKVPRAGFVFGCMVTEDSIKRGAKVRVLRDNTVIAEDTLASLRRFKDDVAEVAQGYECGVALQHYSDIKVGDEFEVYEVREVARV